MVTALSPKRSEELLLSKSTFILKALLRRMVARITSDGMDNLEAAELAIVGLSGTKATRNS